MVQQFLPVTCEGVGDSAGFGVRSQRAGQDHKVQAAKDLLMFPKAFTDQPFEAISVHGEADTPFGNRQSQPWRQSPIGSGQNRQITVSGLEGSRKDRLVVAGGEQAAGFRKITAGRRQAEPVRPSAAFVPWPGGH